MRRNTKRVLIGLFICMNLLIVFCIVIVFSFTGVIPQFEDTSPNGNYVGYQPSSGKVWAYASGFGSGFKFNRLHLKSNLYGRLELVKLLTTENMPEITDLAPWWWGANPDGKTTILIGVGKCPDCKCYEIYDPSRELLFTYEEWD
jgi:hypothetical protein